MIIVYYILIRISVQTKNGRISMAGLNTNNVAYVAEAISKVVKGDS